MIRKLLLPLVAVALLGGCVTSGYSYRQGSGDYYYGAPSVEYRYYSPYPYASPYSYYGYGGRYSHYRGPYRYGYPYGYYGYPYAHPYYGAGYHHHGTPRRPSADPTPDRSRSPWRDLDQLRRRSLVESPLEDMGKPMPRLQPRRTPIEAPAPRSQPRIGMPAQPGSAPAPRRDSSALGGMVRRARKGDPTDETSP